MKRQLKSGQAFLLTLVWLVISVPRVYAGDLLVSPNGQIAVSVHSDLRTFNPASFSVYDRERNVLMDKISLGLKTDRRSLGQDLKLKKISPDSLISEEYTMITGKRSLCLNQARARTYSFENKEGEILNVEFRVYNDGVSFRYTLPSCAYGENLTEELTAYPVKNGLKRWIQEFTMDYEGFYPLSTGETILGRQGKVVNDWSYPALIETRENSFILITEANILRGHSASHLNNASPAEWYKVNMAGSSIPLNGVWTSPWRILITGSLADIVESTLVTDVSEPSKVEDTHWIIPGPVSWIYWAYNHSSGDYAKVKEYIDLAKEMNWPYSLIDWKWDQMGNGGTIENAVNYALQNQVKPLLWYNSSTNWTGPGAPGPLYRLNEKENRVKEYSWLKNLGVSGLKIDFFAGDSAKVMDYYIDLLEDAAEYRLLLNFHGSTIPRGWQRTYPHMMSMEAVYGAEWYNNNDRLTPRAAAHNATLPFVRNVIGPMDYTPGTFSDSQHPHITSHGHELALYVLFESALQHMPDRPESYRGLPEGVKKLLSRLPTAWDDTRLLSGYPGEEVVLARRKGNKWYIAGINGADHPKKISFPTQKLYQAGKNMTIFRDGPGLRSFAAEETRHTQSEVEVACLPRGGFVIVVE